MENFSVEPSVVIVFARNAFPAMFCQKSVKIFEFFLRNSFKIRALRSVFLFFDAHFLQSYLQDPFFIPQLHWQRRD